MAATSQNRAKFEDYEGFTEKFKPKKTTDDCYTPPEVYEAVKNWACRRYGIDPTKIVRPFYPGGDYENFDYSDGAVVLDNPPFSILSQIIRFYSACEIPYFSFCPKLTAIWLTAHGAGIICTGADIRYENGAIVGTAFATSYGENIVQTAPDLQEAIERAQKKEKPRLPKYVYPGNTLTTQSLAAIARQGVPFAIKRTDAAFVPNIDAMRAVGKKLFGGGLLLSDTAAAEKAAAEKVGALVLELSAREKHIVEYLNGEELALLMGLMRITRSVSGLRVGTALLVIGFCGLLRSRGCRILRRLRDSLHAIIACYGRQKSIRNAVAGLYVLNGGNSRANSAQQCSTCGSPTTPASQAARMACGSTQARAA